MSSTCVVNNTNNSVCCKCDGKGSENWVTICISEQNCQKCGGSICYHCKFYRSHYEKCTEAYEKICFNTQDHNVASSFRAEAVDIIQQERERNAGKIV